MKVLNPKALTEEDMENIAKQIKDTTDEDFEHMMKQQQGMNLDMQT